MKYFSVSKLLYTVSFVVNEIVSFLFRLKNSLRTNEVVTVMLKRMSNADS